MSATDTVSIATVDTRHFSFTAAGHTPAQARKALMDGWRMHCEEYPSADPTLMSESDISVTELKMGQCARDGELIANTPRP